MTLPADGESVITLKVWQLMVIGLGVLAAAYTLLGMGNGPSSTPSSSSSVVQQAQMNELQQLVDVAPAVYAFHTKHTSYAGLKLAPATGVAVVNASKATYCLETTGATPHVFKNGPTAHMMIGTCASPAAGTPISG